MRKLLTFMLVLCFSCHCLGQEEGRFRRLLKKADALLTKWEWEGIDTAYQIVPKLDKYVYVGSFTYAQLYRMKMPMSIPQSLQGTYGLKPSYDYRMRMSAFQSEVELGIDYKGVCIEIPLIFHNNFAKGIGLAKTGSVWGFRFRFKEVDAMDGSRNYGGLYEDLSSGLIKNNVQTSERKEYLRKLEGERVSKNMNDLSMFFFEGYYVFSHKRFSIGAGVFSDMVQKKSCGSFIVMGNYFTSHLKYTDLFASNLSDYRTKMMSLGLGYGYNWSFKDGRLLFHFSAIPMFSFKSHLDHSTDYMTGSAQYPLYTDLSAGDVRLYDSADNGKYRFTPSGFVRLSANYSWDRYLFSVVANYRSYGYHNSKKMTIYNGDADIQFNLGMRF